MRDGGQLASSHRHAAQQHAVVVDAWQDADAPSTPSAPTRRDGHESYIVLASDFECYIDELRALGFEF
jgi:hypothetical protein